MDDPTIRFGGVDWATDAHAVCVVDDCGGAVVEFDVDHDRRGLAAMCRRFADAGVQRVAIERPDGPVVEALMAGGFDVFVVPSRAVKAMRLRYGSAGNKSDRSDAYVLADCLRSDGHRWKRLEADTPATVSLRCHVRARKDLVSARVSACNQLRAHLRVHFPAAVGLFSVLDGVTSLAFLRRFPTQARAGRLNEQRLAAWLRAHNYTRTPAAVLLGRLHDAPVATPDRHDDTLAGVTLAYVAVLTELQRQITELQDRIGVLLDTHPDGPIFRSLPRSGTIRAATLLAEIGDSRGRYPDANALACLAGVAPSTRQSGRHHAVTFRWSANKKLRSALCDFAGDSWQGEPWAHDRYRALRATGKTHPHATRILARTWTHIIWRCWQDHTTYDPTRHTTQQAA